MIPTGTDHDFDIMLNEYGYMLQEGGYSVATVNNPAGLRTAGGNILPRVFAVE